MTVLVSRAPVVRLLLALTAASLASCCLLAWASAAAAVEVYTEGKDSSSPFSLVSLPAAFDGGPPADPSLALSLRPLTVFDAESPVWRTSAKEPNPRDVYPLEGGHILTVDKENLFVAELDASGAPVWTYSNEDGAGFKRPFSAQPATFGGRRCILIAERLQYRVFAVTWDSEKEIVWQYGTTGDYGLGVNQLMDPFAAVQLPGGNVLISDENGGNRVIEIRARDYDSAAPDLGYSEDSIVWQYGTPGVAGVEVNQIDQPRWPQRLANGPGPADDTTLFTDANGQRVIEVRDADYDPAAADFGYSAASTVWRYGTPALKGDLTDPNRATRILSGPLRGTTVIADTGGARVLWLSAKGRVTQSLDTNAFAPPPQYITNGSDPRAAEYDEEWGLWIADPGYHRIMRVGYEPVAAATWRPLDCGRPDEDKAFLRLTLSGATARGDVSLGSFGLHYSVDGGTTWKPGRLQGGRVCDFPSGTAGKAIALRITFRSADRWHTPVLDSFTLQYTAASQGPEGGGGGGTSGEGANTGADDGSYTYPGLSGSGTSGGGTGSGASGYGSGSGAAGAGTGAGTTGSTAYGAGLVAPPVPVARGEEEPVTGLAVEGMEGVSGIPLKAAGGAHVESGEDDARAPVSVGGVILLSLGTLAALLLPWPVFAAHLRELSGFDHVRPRPSPPSRPLGR